MNKAPSITMQPCSSSQIASHGYDAATKTLALQFKSKSGAGSLYHYHDVSPEHYAEFVKAKSKGRHFGAKIKNGGFKFTKISAPSQK